MNPKVIFPSSREKREHDRVRCVPVSMTPLWLTNPANAVGPSGYQVHPSENILCDFSNSGCCVIHCQVRLLESRDSLIPFGFVLSGRLERRRWNRCKSLNPVFVKCLREAIFELPVHRRAIVAPRWAANLVSALF